MAVAISGRLLTVLGRIVSFVLPGRLRMIAGFPNMAFKPSRGGFVPSSGGCGRHWVAVDRPGVTGRCQWTIATILINFKVSKPPGT